MVPNMTDIHAHISVKMVRKIMIKLIIIHQLWHRAKLYLTCIRHLWYQLWREFIQPSQMNAWRQTKIMTIWPRANENIFYVHQQPMVLDHGTIYEENPSSHHECKRTDWLTDRLTEGWMSGGFSLFLWRQYCRCRY